MIQSFTKRLVSALLLLLFFSVSCNAQESTTGNVVDPGAWTGATQGTITGCCSGGSQPIITPDGAIHFGYTQGNVTQSIGVSSALKSAGAPVAVNGYNYSWDYVNFDLQRGSISATIITRDANGAAVNSEMWTGGPTASSQPEAVAGSVTYSAPYASYDLSTIDITFTGKDDRFWAGYYGPVVSNINLNLRYSADLCVMDPLSDPSCPGYAQAFHDMQCTADPLFAADCPGYAQAYFDQQCGFNPLYDNQCPGYQTVVTGPTFATSAGTTAISTALSHTGAGLTIYGFDYGFSWKRGEGSCSFSLFGICLAIDTYSTAKNSITITNGDGTTLHTNSWNFSGNGSASGSVNDRVIFYGANYNSLELGNLKWSPNTSNQGAIYNYWARPLMLPDQCAMDPLFSPSCSGYPAAYLALQCGISQLYSTECPGYVAALQAMIDEAAAQAAAAIASSDTATTTAVTDTVAATTTTSSVTTVATGTSTDPTSTTTTTADLGGAELTATGEIVVTTDVPAAAVESSVSSTTEAATETTVGTDTKTIAEKITMVAAVEETAATKSTETAAGATEKKEVTVDAVGLAMSAVGAANDIANSTAAAAVEASNSENANPSDGTGLGDAAKVVLTGAEVTAGSNTAIAETALVSAKERRQRTEQLVAMSTPATSLQTVEDTQSNQDLAFSQQQNLEQQRSLENFLSANPTAYTTPVEEQNTVDGQVLADAGTTTSNTSMQVDYSLSSSMSSLEVPGAVAKPGPSVRRGGAVSELAGGPDIQDLAQTPAGFNQYQNQQMVDSNFYASREIYRGQKNVDNARALRQLGSDRLHEQMVQEQYRSQR